MYQLVLETPNFTQQLAQYLTRILLVKHLGLWIMTYVLLSVCRRWLPRRASPTATFYCLFRLSLYNSFIVKHSTM